MYCIVTIRCKKTARVSSFNLYNNPMYIAVNVFIITGCVVQREQSKQAVWIGHLVQLCTQRQWHLMLLLPHLGKFSAVEMVKISTFLSFFFSPNLVNVYGINLLTLQDWDFSEKQRIGILMGGYYSLLTRN